jgi:hypothetical protein
MAIAPKRSGFNVHLPDKLSGCMHIVISILLKKQIHILMGDVFARAMLEYRIEKSPGAHLFLLMALLRNGPVNSIKPA